MKKAVFLLSAILLSICSYSQFSAPSIQGTGWSFKTSELQVLLKQNTDTLEIVGKQIRFIKIDGKVYEIIRTTNLKEIEKPFSIVSYFGGIVNKDTTSYFRFKNK